MTPTDLEAMVKNLDVRTTRIEQILPTLATKDDVREAIRDLATKEDLKAYATKDDLREGLADARSYARVLYEDLKSDIHLLAEHVVRIAQAVDRLEKRP